MVRDVILRSGEHSCREQLALLSESTSINDGRHDVKVVGVVTSERPNDCPRQSRLNFFANLERWSSFGAFWQPCARGASGCTRLDPNVACALTHNYDGFLRRVSRNYRPIPSIA
jgi:hypothetical protein